MHSVRIELAKMILVGTRITYQGRVCFIKDKPLIRSDSADLVAHRLILYKQTKVVPLGSIHPPTDNVLRG